MGWYTTKEGNHVNTAWFNADQKRKYDQIAKNQAEADKLNGKGSYEKVGALVFGTAHITDNFIDIDGYSNKATIKGALGDLARALDKYDKGEADAVRDTIKFDEVAQAKYNKEDGPDQYILEWEEVPNAGRFNADDEYETKPAKWYIHTRILRG